MDGEVGILNVGAGDVKINFNSKDPAEVIRAGRIVSDMLRRGYALLVIDKDGKATRATKFDPETCTYTIADYDPTPDGRAANTRVQNDGTDEEEGEEEAPEPETTKRGGRTRKVNAKSVRAVAVARTAGG